MTDRSGPAPPRGLDDRSDPPKNGPPVAILVETPDPDGRRWQAALELLLEAGRTAATETDTSE